MRHELCSPRIAADTSRTYAISYPAPGRLESHGEYFGSLSALNALMRACAASPDFQPSETARRISDRLKMVADHPAEACPFCGLEETCRAESEFLEAVDLYRKSVHRCSSSSLFMVWVSCPGKDEGDPGQRFLLEECEVRLRGKHASRG